MRSKAAPDEVPIGEILLRLYSCGGFSLCFGLPKYPTSLESTFRFAIPSDRTAISLTTSGSENSCHSNPQALSGNVSSSPSPSPSCSSSLSSWNISFPKSGVAIPPDKRASISIDGSKVRIKFSSFAQRD